MSKVGMVAKLVAKPGKRDELVKAFGVLVDAAEGEPGTLLYVLNADASNEDVVWFYELYADDAALAAHAGSDAMKAALEAGGELLAGAPELMMVHPLRASGIDL